MARLEYDRFGPWVIEISEADPVPPLFEPYVDGAREPVVAVKVPRPIERRNASPDMDLYDYLLTLYEDEVQVLSRERGSVRDVTFAYSEIERITFSEDLLAGHLELCAKRSTFDLPFNAVSSEIMENVVDEIRRRYLASAAPAEVPAGSRIDRDELSHYFAGLLARHQRTRPEFRLLAAQFEHSVAETESSTFRRLVYGIIGKRILESLHLSDGRELEVIDRGMHFRYFRQAVYGTSTSYVPLDRIVALDWSDDPGTGITTLRIATASGESSFVFDSDNPTLRGYREALERLAGVDAGGIAGHAAR